MLGFSPYRQSQHAELELRHEPGNDQFVLSRHTLPLLRETGTPTKEYHPQS